jgi:hypothetical protein
VDLSDFKDEIQILEDEGRCTDVRFLVDIMSLTPECVGHEQATINEQKFLKHTMI